MRSTPVIIEPRGMLNGSIRTPGDKSISHRALLFGALAEGPSPIIGLSHGEDVARTKQIMIQLGARITHDVGGDLVVEGGDLHASTSPLECGNSGTTMRLVAGFVAGISGTHELIGDASLSRRPMDRVAIPLEQMGAHVRGIGPTRHAPLTITGGPLQAIEYHLPIPSAQVKSAILIAGLHAHGTTIVHEQIATRPHTEEMLAQAGATIAVHADDDGFTIEVEPGPLTATRWVIPADPSQAAFWAVAGTLAASGAVSCNALYPGSSRTGFLGVLERMGAAIARDVDADGLLCVTAHPAPLVGVDVDAAEIPSLDEIPALVIAASAAEGTTRFFDAGELRIKESDRMEKAIELARGLGATASADGDTLVIEGLGSPRAFQPLTIDAEGDHRIAMAGAVGGAVGAGATILGFESVATSYPGFLSDLESLS